jgi:hypothetical protein
VFDINGLTEEEKEKLMLLARYHGTMKESIAGILHKIEDEKRTLAAGRKTVPRIRIRDRAYPNVTVRIWDSFLVLKSQEMYVSFSVDRERNAIAKGVF